MVGKLLAFVEGVWIHSLQPTHVTTCHKPVLIGNPMTSWSAPCEARANILHPMRTVGGCFGVKDPCIFGGIFSLFGHFLLKFDNVVFDRLAPFGARVSVSCARRSVSCARSKEIGDPVV